ncbi:hypothetical protein DRN69_05425 [Candidatus Pacearchaeota archaeon]|nr:MAG: hypothetical protein DRN69_05425 [Candidatus Pacearchaeota archaeon]
MVYKFTVSLPDEYKELIQNLMSKLGLKTHRELLDALINFFLQKNEKYKLKKVKCYICGSTSIVYKIPEFIYLCPKCFNLIKSLAFSMPEEETKKPEEEKKKTEEEQQKEEETSE